MELENTPNIIPPIKVKYNKQDKYFIFYREEYDIYDCYCRTIQDLVDMLRTLSDKMWYSIELQNEVFSLYDNIVRK